MRFPGPCWATAALIHCSNTAHTIHTIPLPTPYYCPQILLPTPILSTLLPLPLLSQAATFNTTNHKLSSFPLTALCPHVRHQLFLMILLLSVVHISDHPPGSFTKCSGVVVCEGNSDLPNCKTLSSMPENYTQCNNFCCPLSRFYYSADPLLSAADLHNT